VVVGRLGLLPRVPTLAPVQVPLIVTVASLQHAVDTFDIVVAAASSSLGYPIVGKLMVTYY
jgi:hypothetical protein